MARHATGSEAEALGWAGATVGLALVVIAAGWLVMWRAQLAATPEPANSPPRLAALNTPPKAPLEAVSFARGKKLFGTCALCHGPDGKGLPKLGKDLTGSYFVSSTDDPGMVAFIKKGRPITDPANTTKIPMPPSGGNTLLTDADLADVVTYLRGLQEPGRAPKVLPEVAVPAAAVVSGEAPKGANDEETAWIASGMKIYNATCIACHGAGGVGMPGNGKPLATSVFVSELKDDDLLAFVKKGRDPGDPKNTTGVAMPPRGGNPALSDDDLLDVISYVRALQRKDRAAATAN